MKTRLKWGVLVSCLAVFCLGCDGGGGDAGGGSSEGTSIVEPRGQGDSTPGLKEEGKLPERFKK
jgi:hypothetical protein